jgi:hypothetical protein
MHDILIMQVFDCFYGLIHIFRYPPFAKLQIRFILNDFVEISFANVLLDHVNIVQIIKYVIQFHNIAMALAQMNFYLPVNKLLDLIYSHRLFADDL